MPGTKEVSIAKRHARDEAIGRVAESLSEGSLEAAALIQFLNADAAQIVKKIETKEWTATVVLKAYLQRAIQAQAAVNPITEGEHHQYASYLTRLDY